MSFGGVERPLPNDDLKFCTLLDLKYSIDCQADVLNANGHQLAKVWFRSPPIGTEFPIRKQP